MSTDIKKNNLFVKNRYRPEIDGLRAFAVVAVIINHFNKEILPNGYLGVDIFFVISGFVITSSLYQRPSENFKDFISGFYERRIKRLVPALSVFVLIMSIAICLFNPNPIWSLRTGLTSLFGLSNLYLLKKSTDYFAQSTELNVFTHTWSLGVEEQFYILFPFLIWFSGFGRQAKNGVRNLFLIIGTLAITSLIGFLYLYPINQPAAYFLMPARFWEMASGCLLFLGIQKRKSLEYFLEKVPQIFVVAVIVGIMYLSKSWATASTVAVVILTSILITSLKKQTFMFKIFTHPKVVYIGLISYPLYLWHWGVLSISRWTIGIHWWSEPFQVALILGLAIASFRYIETPLRKSNWFGKRWKIFAFGSGIVGAMSVSITIMDKTDKLFFLGEDNMKIFKTINFTPYSRNQVTKNTDNEHCDFRGSNTFDPEKCNYGLAGEVDNINRQSFYFVGSSHAGTLSGMIGSLKNKESTNLYSLYVGATFFPPLNSNFFPKGYRESPKKYNQNQTKILRFITKNAKDGDVVVISNHLELYGTPASSIPANHNEIVRQYFDNLEKFTSEMRSLDINVVLIGPMPFFVDLTQHMDNTLNCQSQLFKIPDPKCVQSFQRQEMIDSNKTINEFSLAWEDKFDNAYYFKVFDYFCPQSNYSCDNRVNGEIYMYDKSHLNFYGGQFLSSRFIEFIKSKGLVLR